MELYELKRELENLSSRSSSLKDAVGLEGLVKEVEENELIMNSNDFWNDKDKANKILSKVKSLKNKRDAINKVLYHVEELEVLVEFIEGSLDDELVIEAVELISVAKKDLADLEISIMLSGEYDELDALLEIHPGAGGTESQDWALMLYRMYQKWALSKGFKFTEIDYLKGDEAGLKSVTFKIEGLNAYGLLESEKGVHRLVRISPFDSSKKRHTSFASVNVLPEIDETINVEIKDEDIKIDTYRSSGAGGQSVNTTDSAVRITYLPLNIVVTCQNERSQIKNREVAMNLLKSKIHQHELMIKRNKIDEIQGSQDQIAFGSQIRSYVMHPYSLVKDTRTKAEHTNVKDVMDGDIDIFIDAYLRDKLQEEE